MSKCDCIPGLELIIDDSSRTLWEILERHDAIIVEHVLVGAVLFILATGIMFFVVTEFFRAVFLGGLVFLFCLSKRATNSRSRRASA